MPEYFSGELGWGNLELPNVYLADDTAALYPNGTKLVQGERVFHYGRYLGKLTESGTAVTATTPGDDLAGKFLFTMAAQQDMANGLLVRKLANELHIVFNTTVSAAQSNDYYSGGWVTGKDTVPADERMFWRYIVKHTYQSSTGTSFEIWNDDTKSYSKVSLSSYSNVSILELDQPVINSKSGMATTLMQNPWKHIVWQSASAYSTNRGKVMGACMHNDPAMNGYGWYQTWGPMSCMHLEYALGGAEGCNTLILMADGSISARNSNSGTYDRLDDHKPIIGYLLSDPRSLTGSFQGESLPMIFVTISP